MKDAMTTAATATDPTFSRALKWSYIMNWGEQGMSAALAFVLAVILGPADFGIIAIAMVYILFIHMFLDQGLVAAIIQRKDLKPEHLDSVFWLVQAVCVLLVTLAILLSGWWAAVNHTPKLASLIYWLSLTIPIESLAVVQKAVLQREMDFRSLSIRTNLSVIGGGIVGIAMAFGGYGVWSLVGQQVSMATLALIMLWKLSHWRPGFRFSFDRLKDLFHFSIANFAAKLGVFANQQVDVILMGIFFGPVPVGLFRFASRAMNTFFRISQFSLMSISLPEFSRWQDDQKRLRASVLTCIRLCGALSVPALAGLAATSHLVMRLVGAKWLDAGPGLQVLCVVGMMEGFAQFAGPLLQAVNRPHLLAGLSWLQTVLNATLLAAAAYLLRGATDRNVVLGVSATHLVALLCVAMPVALYTLGRFCRVNLWDVMKTVAPSITSGVFTAAVAWALQRLGLFAGWRPLAELAVIVAVAAPLGIGVLLGLDKTSRALFATMLPRFRRKNAGQAPEQAANAAPRVAEEATPKVSVLVPTYNRSHVVVRALESIAAQTYRNWEIIVIDDGSTDDTAEQVRRFGERHGLDETRLIYLFQPNQGKSVALNEGIKRISGEWTGFLDSDDVWLPEKLELQWKALRQFGERYQACFADGRYVNSPDLRKTVFEVVQRREREWAAALLDAVPLVIDDRHGIPIISVLMKSSLLKLTGGFDPRLRVAEDRDFLYRLAQVTDLCFVNQPLVEIDRTPNRQIGLIEMLGDTSVFLEQHLHLYQKWLETCGPADSARRRQIMVRIQELYSRVVNQALAEGRQDDAAAYAREAYRTLPSFRYWMKLRLTEMTPALVRQLSRQSPGKGDN